MTLQRREVQRKSTTVSPHQFCDNASKVRAVAVMATATKYAQEDVKEALWKVKNLEIRLFHCDASCFTLFTDSVVN